MSRIRFGRRLTTILAAAILVMPAKTQAGVIVGYDPSSAASHNTYDRFQGPYPTNPGSANSSSQFVLSQYANTSGTGRSLSGIGWGLLNQGQFSVTLVSPQHIIGAFHVFETGFHFQPGATVNFVNRNGELKSYTLSNAQPFRPTTTFTNSMGQQQTLPSDVYLGTLSAPIPAADLIDFFPVATGPAGSFLNAPIFAYGQNPAYVNPSTGTASPHIGKNNIDEIGLASFDGPDPVSEATMAYAYNFNSSLPGEFHVIGGDSGGGSFVNLGNQLALTGAHYGLDSTDNTSADSYLPFYIDQLNAAMLSNSPYSLTLATIPEPSSLVFAAFASAIAIRRLRRRAH